MSDSVKLRFVTGLVFMCIGIFFVICGTIITVLCFVGIIRPEWIMVAFLIFSGFLAFIIISIHQFKEAIRRMKYEALNLDFYYDYYVNTLKKKL